MLNHRLAGFYLLQAERQWSVRIGNYYCAIGLFGTDDNGNPKLVPISDKQ